MGAGLLGLCPRGARRGVRRWRVDQPARRPRHGVPRGQPARRADGHVRGAHEAARGPAHGRARGQRHRPAGAGGRRDPGLVQLSERVVLGAARRHVPERRPVLDAGAGRPERRARLLVEAARVHQARPVQGREVHVDAHRAQGRAWRLLPARRRGRHLPAAQRLQEQRLQEARHAGGRALRGEPVARRSAAHVALPLVPVGGARRSLDRPGRRRLRGAGAPQRGPTSAAPTGCARRWSCAAAR
jgi:hypothetical protein